MSEREITDHGAIRSSESGRIWGVSVDRSGGDEEVIVTELAEAVRPRNKTWREVRAQRKMSDDELDRVADRLEARLDEMAEKPPSEWPPSRAVCRKCRRQSEPRPTGSIPEGWWKLHNPATTEVAYLCDECSD